ncbi:MAG: phage integrase N-terminal SAM-like domain-containing protein [Actinobacteria bacterium]|nr:phage integrase N-terminal SAM-like domain-containing protein [Actinomycetota bacterium]
MRVQVPNDFRELAQSVRRSLLAGNLAPKTIRTYPYAVDQFAAFLESQGMPQSVASVRREHVEAFFADLLAQMKPATAAIRYRSLQQFWRWCAEDGEVDRSLTERMSPPKVPEDPPAVITDVELRRLLGACCRRAPPRGTCRRRSCPRQAGRRRRRCRAPEVHGRPDSGPG